MRTVGNSAAESGGGETTTTRGRCAAGEGEERSGSAVKRGQQTSVSLCHTVGCELLEVVPGVPDPTFALRHPEEQVPRPAAVVLLVLKWVDRKDDDWLGVLFKAVQKGSEIPRKGSGEGSAKSRKGSGRLSTGRRQCDRNHCLTVGRLDRKFGTHARSWRRRCIPAAPKRRRSTLSTLPTCHLFGCARLSCTAAQSRGH